MADIINMADQFSGLPMESLIGGPLQAACKAEVMLAAATTNFIETVGFQDKDEKTRTLPARPRRWRLPSNAPQPTLKAKPSVQRQFPWMFRF